MSSALSSVIQGTIAGFTAIYLHDQVQLSDSDQLPNQVKKTEPKTDDTRKYTADTWKYVALQVNHLFLLTGGAIRLASIPLGVFGFLTKTIYILTPFVLIAGLLGKEPTSFEAERINQFGNVYLVGVAVNALANLVLGNPLFAIAILSTFVIDQLTKEKGSTLLKQIKKVAAVFAMFGYGLQVFAAHGIMATLAKISTVIMAIKLLLDHFSANSQESRPTIIPPETKDSSSKDSDKKDGLYPNVEQRSPGLSDSIPELSELSKDCPLNQPPAQQDGPLAQEQRPVSQPVASHKDKDGPKAESPLRPRVSPAVPSPNLLKVPVLTRPPISAVLPSVFRIEQNPTQYSLLPPVHQNGSTYVPSIQKISPPPPIVQQNTASFSSEIANNLVQPSVWD